MRLPPAIAAILIAALPAIAAGQRTYPPGGGMPREPRDPRPDVLRAQPLPQFSGDTTTPEGLARVAQIRFEEFRRNNLPNAPSVRASNCDEQVGRFCYWYDEKAPKSIELPKVTEARTKFLVLLD